MTIDKINQINQNLTTLTTDYLRTIDGLENTLTIICTKEDITRLEPVLNNLEHYSLQDMMELEDITYTEYHILMSMWNIYQTIISSELMNTTYNMLVDYNIDLEQPYTIVWKENKFILEEAELPLFELNGNEDEILEEVVE